MSHLTTADVLLIGILLHPVLNTLLWVWRAATPYFGKLLWVKVEALYDLDSWITENLKPLISFGNHMTWTDAFNIMEPMSALFLHRGMPFFLNVENVQNRGIVKYIYIPRWVKFEKLFSEYLGNFFKEPEEKKTRYHMKDLHEYNFFPYAFFKNEKESHPNGYRRKPLYKPEVKYALSPDQEKLEQDLKNFLDSRQLYKDKGMAFRRGYHLWGLPGSGKSAFVKYLAQKYDIPLFTSNLSKALPKDRDQDCVVFILIDDFDRIFHGDCRVGASGEKKEDKDVPVTFQDLLNKMSGVDAYTNVVWFITSNDVKKVDDAIGVPVVEPGEAEPRAFSKTTRAKRLDRALKFGYATAEQKRHICHRILGEEPTAKDLFDDMTTATYEDLCTTRAINRIFT